MYDDIWWPCLVVTCIFTPGDFTCSNPIWSWISEWSWPISWYFRWIHDTGWRFQSSSGVLVFFFVIFHPRSRLALQISKAMAEPSKSPTLVSVESKSSRRRKSPPQGVMEILVLWRKRQRKTDHVPCAMKNAAWECVKTCSYRVSCHLQLDI